MRHFVAVLAALAVLTVLLSRSLAAEKAPQTRARNAEKPTGYDAEFVKMNDVPKKLLAGQVFYVEYTLKNTGSEGWGPDNEKHTVLRSRVPDDNKTWGTFFITQGQGTSVPPGTQFTYRSWLMAPSAPGEYTLQWQPANPEGEGYAGKVTPFGEPTPRLLIQVQKRPEEPAVPALPSPAPGEKQVLAMDDFECVGSFKITRSGAARLPIAAAPNGAIADYAASAADWRQGPRPARYPGLLAWKRPRRFVQVLSRSGASTTENNRQ